MRRWLVGLLVAVVCGAGWAEEGARKVPFTVSKETTRITGPLREDGTVDYVAALNEKYGKGVKAEENAFVAWMEVVGSGKEVFGAKTVDATLRLSGAKASEGMRMRFYNAYLKDQGVKDDVVLYQMDEEIDAHKRLWSADDFPMLAKYLEEKGEYLDKVKEAFARKKYWMPYVSSDGRTVRMVLLSTTARMRDGANGLAARATLRAKAGDFAGFLSDLVAIKRMSKHLGSGGFVIERVVGVAIDAVASETAGAVAGSGALTEGQSATLWKALDDAGELPAMLDVLDISERWDLLDSVATLAVGKGGLLNSAGTDNDHEEDSGEFSAVAIELVDWDTVLKHMNVYADEAVAAARKGSLQEVAEAWSVMEGKRRVAGLDWDARPLENESREEYTARVEKILLAVLGNYLGKVEELRRRAMMQGEMAKAMAAAAGFRAATGKWPAKAGDLAPGYLKAVPRDIYSEDGKGEVGFVVAEAGAKFVSVGWKSSGGKSNHPIEIGAK